MPLMTSLGLERRNFTRCNGFNAMIQPNREKQPMLMAGQLLDHNAVARMPETETASFK